MGHFLNGERKDYNFELVIIEQLLCTIINLLQLRGMNLRIMKIHKIHEMDKCNRVRKGFL